MCRLLSSVFLGLAVIDLCGCFVVPGATLQFLVPKGLKISIPDTDPDVSLVAFHVNVNEKFVGVEHGQWAADIHKRREGRWSYTIRDLRVKRGDTVYYWVYAIKHGVGYQLLHQSHSVTEDDLHISGPMTVKPSNTATTPGTGTSSSAAVTCWCMSAEPPSTTVMPTTGKPSNAAATTRSPMSAEPSSTTVVPAIDKPYSVATTQWPISAEAPSTTVASTTVRPMFSRPYYAAVATNEAESTTYSQQCELSLSTVRQATGTNRPCVGSELFSAAFHTASDLDKWAYDLHIGGNEPEDNFTVFTRDTLVARSGNGLVIQPTLFEDYSKYVIVNGSLMMDPCTFTEPQYCQVDLTQPQMPVLSARLSTKNSFNFCYGTVEIKAKLPKGDWIVPELWLVPVNKYQSSCIIVAMSRGNAQLNVEGESIASDVLEAGVVFNSARVTFDLTQDVSWADDYHVFKLVWKPDVMEFYVDNFQYAKWAPGKARPPVFDTEFYISLGVHVGGLRDFPDRAIGGSRPKPWKNTDPMAKLTFWQAKNMWYPSWNKDSALTVDYVKVSAL